MRRVGLAPVWMQGDWNLADPGTTEARLYDHFGGELHTCAALLQAFIVDLREATHAAVDIVNGSLEPSPRHRGKYWIAQPAMRERHRARFYGATACRKPTALHKIVPFTKPVHKFWNFKKIVAIVGVAHDDVLAAGCRDATH